MPEDFITPVHTLPESESEVQMPVPPNGQKLSETPRGVSREVSRATEFRVLPEIDNTNRNFKGQQKNEVVLCFCRKHWIVLVPHFIGALLVAVGLTFFISSSSFRNLFVIAGLTYYLHYFFVRFFNYYLQIVIVTNFRVIHLDQTLYFHRNRDSIDLPEIQDIVIRQNGIIKTLLNYGEIIITLSSAHASKTLACVPNPEYYFRKINKTKREYITVRRAEKGKEPIKE